MIKGVVHLEWVDVNTGEKLREHTQENFIFFGSYADLWISGSGLERPAIIGRGTDVFPYYDKERSFYGGNQPAITGYIPEGQTRKKFFEKTDNSDAYWDFYSLFLPPAVVSSIPCISLTSTNSDNTNVSTTDGTNMWTALNLDPYCWQSPTEYLNVYYRLIMLEDQDNQSPDFIRSQFVLDLDRYSYKTIFPNEKHKSYPFRISEDMTRNGYINFLSDYYSEIANKQTTRPRAEHNKLINCQKTYTYPDDNPNQYNQLNYGLVNTVVRGSGNARLRGFNWNDTTYGTRVVINPMKLTPEIGLGFTGIGNVFSASKGSKLTVFDPAFFPAGAGRMQAGGVLTDANPDPFPTTFQCEITKAGQSMADATYRLYEWRGLHPQSMVPCVLPLFPAANMEGSQWDFVNDFVTPYKNMMYKDASRIHISKGVVKYIEDRAFITWDKTGITIYDIYLGKLESFDALTPAALGVTEIVDVKVDTTGAIWVACAQSGLWKLVLNADQTVTLTHIGVLPGSQQKCYAIDVDNFGNVFAIFWGQGLFYSSDGGTSWVNVPIDYAPFSGFESGGFVSKWSYVARMIVNPWRNATNGVAQYLILMAENSPDYSASGGCWYDAQSQITTGITNLDMKNQLVNVRRFRYGEQIKISDATDTWYFMETANQMRRMPYQNNAATLLTVVLSNNGMAACAINQEWGWDNESGTLKEYMIPGVQMGDIYYTSTGTFSIWDCLLMVEKKFPIKNNGWASGLSDQNSTHAVKIGHNMFVGFRSISVANTNTYVSSWVVANQLPFSKDHRQWSQKNWGWNGSKWTLNHLGNKPVHSTYQDIFRGMVNKFTDGAAATVSWVLGDTFTTTVFDGFFKDNSTTMALRDTIYYKPTHANEAFEPNVVTRIDRSTDVGILNAQPLELEWNIDDLPDTQYSGGSVTTDGDPFFQNTVYLALFNQLNGFNATKGVHKTIVGVPSIDPTSPIFGDSMVKLDGNSGFYVEPSSNLALGNRFTVEGMFKPSETGTKMHLFDTRSTTGSGFAFYINVDGKLEVEIGGSTFGNIGDFVFPGQTYYIALQRVDNDWHVYLNGVEQFTFQNGVNLAASSPLSTFKRFQTTSNGWEGLKGWGSNLRITRDVLRTIEIPTAFYKTQGNDYSGAQLVLSGNYNMGSLTAKKELVGNWEVIFRDITPEMMAERRSRPKLAFGVTIQKFIESPTDISYKMIGRKVGKFDEPYFSGQMTEIPTSTVALRIKKVGFMVSIYRSNDGVNWIPVRENMQDYNPLHHIAMWQVQKDVAPMLTPSVEIVNNGSAVFSKIGTATSARGYFHPKFLVTDVATPTDINIQLNGVQVSKGRSNFLDIGYPLQGEVLAMQGGTLTFHEQDIGKLITGKMITLHD